MDDTVEQADMRDDDEIPHSTGRNVVRGPRATGVGLLIAEIDRLTAERIDLAGMIDDAMAALQAVRELVGAQDDETTLQAVQDMMTERQHYVREANRAHTETIPALQSRADGYALLVGEYRAAGQELLSSHDNLYLAVFGESSDPTIDIAAKAMRAILAADPEARAAELLQEPRKNSASIVE